MIYDIFKLLFLILSAAVSTVFYVKGLTMKYIVKKSYICIFCAISISYLVLLVPAGDILQMILEFVIVAYFSMGSMTDKLISYVEVNIAFGAGMTAAYYAVGTSLGNYDDVFSDIGTKYILMYYVVSLGAAVCILNIIYTLNNKRKDTESVWRPEVSVSVAAACICFLFSVSTVVLESKNNWNHMTVLVFMGFGIFIWAYWNLREEIKKREEAEIKSYVLNRLRIGNEDLKKMLDMEEKWYCENLELINENIEKAYKLAANKTLNNDSNYILKKILSDKKKKAEDKGISVEMKVKYGTRIEMSERDIVCVAGNILDNATEAAEKVSSGAYIKVWGEISEDKFFFSVENSHEGNIKRKGNRFLTTKADRSSHGIGMKNITETAKKYGLKTDVEITDRLFKLTVYNSKH